MDLLMRNDNILIKVVREDVEKKVELLLPDSVKQDEKLTNAKFIIDDFDVDYPANEGLKVGKQIWFNPFTSRVQVDADHFILKQEDILAVMK